MITTIVCVKDEKLGAYNQPAFTGSVGVAIRSFQDAIKNPERGTDIARHPEDFSLWKLGTYNDDTGTFDTHAPEFITKGIDHV